MTSHDFASHMDCFNKSSWRAFGLTSDLQCVYLPVNKVAVLVSRVKSTNAFRAYQREWLLTILRDS